MRGNWIDNQVADAWAHANGGPKNPRGDRWRTAIVNPVTLRVAEAALKGHSTDPTTAFHDAIADQRDSLGAIHGDAAVDRALLEWHRKQSKERKKLAGLRVLDLGCGEGYLGRWMALMGASYFGVDVSPPLIRHARQRWKTHVSQAPVGRTPKSQRPRSARGADHRSPSCELFQADLDVVPADGSPLARHIEASPPHLVVSALTLDHLLAPADMLAWLSLRLAQYSPNATVLMIVLNWRRFIERSDPLGQYPALSVDGRELRARATIDSADATVEVLLRTRRFYDRLFRDSGFHALSTSPLPFASGLEPHTESPFSGLACCRSLKTDQESAVLLAEN